MIYRIRPLKNGQCKVAGHHAFRGGDPGETYGFYLYVWLIEGGERPMLVDTGPKDLATFHAATRSYIPGGIVQRRGETTPELLAAAGVAPADVSHVFITHLHPDHYEYFDLFPDAVMVASARGFKEALMGIRPNVMQALAARWPESLRLVGDEEVVPGIRTVWLGCHSPCSQAIVVRTAIGGVVLSGDVAYLYGNIERLLPIGWADGAEWHAAMARARAAGEILLPGHDPAILERYPAGIIAPGPGGEQARRA